MADSVLKKVRVSDGIFVEVFSQGRRKYAIVNNAGVEYRGEKFREPYTEDQIIKETLSAYARTQGKFYDYYKIIQDPYKDPWPIRTTYGNGDKSPYYLNNGCKINIQWIGRLPNPEFNPGTFSNPGDAEDVTGSPDRWLYDQVITSSVDDASNSDTLPKSTWVIPQPFQINQVSGMSSPNYRDTAYVNDKIVTVSLPDGIKEEGDYLVWTDGGLLYNTKAIPATASFEEFRITRGGLGMGGRPQDQISYWGENFKDSDIISRVIDKFVYQVSKVHGIYTNDYNLQLCSPDTASCSVIPYKSPLVPENKPPVTPESQPPGPTMSATNPKVKFTIDGIAEPIEIKVNTDLPNFTIWAGPIPKPIDQVDSYEDLEELDSEYTEGEYSGEEERALKMSAGEGLKSEAEYQADLNDTYTPNDPATSNTPGGGTGLKSTGTYTSELPTESPKGSGTVKPGFNGVPYYQQFDTRWGNVIYGRAKDGTFVEATIKPAKGWVNVTWNGSTYTVNCDHFNGDSGFSSIHGGGCGITSTSMIINYWAVKGKCKPTSPVKIAKLASENGARPGPPCNGTQPGGKNGAFGKAIKSAFNIDFDATNSADAQKLVKAGFPVLFCGQNFSGKNSSGSATSPYGGHFIVITGYDNGKWRVNDPGRNVDKGGITYFDKFPSGGLWKFVPSGMSV